MQYFDIILFAIVAGILAIRLYRALGRKSDAVFRQKRDVEDNNSVATKTQTVNEQSSSINGEGLDFLKNLDPAFSEKSFILGAKKAFKLIARDFIYAFLGLIISVALAAAANKSIRDAIFASISV